MFALLQVCKHASRHVMETPLLKNLLEKARLAKDRMRLMLWRVDLERPAQSEERARDAAGGGRAKGLCPSASKQRRCVGPPYFLHPAVATGGATKGVMGHNMQASSRNSGQHHRFSVRLVRMTRRGGLALICRGRARGPLHPGRVARRGGFGSSAGSRLIAP